MFQLAPENPPESSHLPIRRLETVLGKTTMGKGDLVTGDTGDGKEKQKNYVGYAGPYQIQDCIGTSSMCMDNPIFSVNVPGMKFFQRRQLL